MYREFYQGAFVEPALFALVLFAVLFVGVVAWAFWPRSGERRFDQMARLPIDEEGRHHG